MLKADKVSCKAVGPSRYVVYTAYDQIRKLEVAPPSIRVLLESNGSRILGLAVDVRREYLYWIDEYAPAIYRSDLGKNTSMVLRGVGHPSLLAVDWVSGNVYFYDMKSSSIKLCSFERQVCVRVIKFSTQVFIKALTVDPVNHSLFYSLMHYWIFEVPHSIVYRANLDGTKQQVVTLNVSHVTALECDPESRMLYMTDVASKSLYKVDYEGRQLTKVNLGAQRAEALNIPIGITLFENQALILNMASSTVGQCRLYGDFSCKLLQLNVHNSNQLLVVQESRQPMPNPNSCARANCSVVCVPAESGPKCICHDGQHVREGDQCPLPSDEPSDLQLALHEPGTSDSSSSSPSSSSSTTWHVLFGLTTLTLVVGSLLYVYRRRFQHKFAVGMHFHNPELSTIDSSEVKMFQGPPQIHHTATHSELTLETPPPIPCPGHPGGSGEGGGGGGLSRDVTTTALELENMSDVDSMKDAYDCGIGGGDDQRQRLIM